MKYLNNEQIKHLFKIRKQMDARIEDIKDDVKKINESNLLIRNWTFGSHEVGEVRSYKDIPYRCVQSHTCTEEQDWTPPNTPALWMQYHGTSPESARPWIQPLGAHDMYKNGEYMIWTDGKIYQCLVDTIYSPNDYMQAWNVVE